MTYTILKSSSAVLAMAACLAFPFNSRAQSVVKAPALLNEQAKRVVISPSGAQAVGRDGLNIGTISAQSRGFDDIRYTRLGTYKIDVPEGKIFAAQLGANDIDYWFIDAATGTSTAKHTLAARPGPTLYLPGQPLTPSRASVSFKLNAAQGIYLTSKVAGIKPKYQISFEGTAVDNSLSTWLAKGSSNEANAFAALRSSNSGTSLASMHRSNMTPKARALLDLTKSSIDTWTSEAQALIEEDLVLAHQRMMYALDFFYDLSDVDDDDLIAMNTSIREASDGTLPLRPWVAEMEQLAADFETQATGHAYDLQAAMNTVPFPKSDFVDQLKNCLNIEGFVTGFTAEIPFLEENKDTMNDDNDPFTKRLRGKSRSNSDAQEIDYWDERADNAEDESERWRSCMESIVGDEPSIDNPDISEDDYIDILERAQALAKAREQKVHNIMDYLDTFSEFWEGRYGETEGSGISGQAPKYTPKKWLESIPRAEELVNSITGQSRLLGGSSSAPVIQRRNSFSPLAFTISSPTACNNPTFDIRFNVLGIGVILGTPWDDRIQGNDIAGSYEFIAGLSGDDCINARDGHELVLGLAGKDEMHGGDGHEIMAGGGGDDTIYAGHGEDYSVPIGNTGTKLRFYIGSLLSGSRGNDTLFGNDPANTPMPQFPFVEGSSSMIFGDGLDGLNSGTSGDDIINIQGGISIAFGQRGNDVMTSTKGGRVSVVDVSGSVGAPIKFGSFFIGQSGKDTITGSPSYDFIMGNDGEDTLSGGRKLDMVFGGKEADIISGNRGIDLLFGGSGNDKVDGNENEDLIIGWHGNDTLHGGGGIVDAVFGGTGSDDAYGDGGLDFVSGGRGEDIAEGGEGIDLVLGGAGNDTARGNAGIDLVLAGADNDLAEGGSGIDFVVGSDGLDTLRGNDGIDVMLGLERSDLMYGDNGIDLMFGGGHDDIVYGGESLDLIVGWTGSDCLFGQNGTDLIIGNSASDYLSGGAGTDLLLGGDGNDQLNGDGGFDILLGSDGTDNLFGADGTDLILGQAGADFISGGGGADIMFGGDANDMFLGGAGFDFGAGSDGRDHFQMTEAGMGGKGEDYFAYTQNDTGFFAGLGGKGIDHMTISEANVAGLSGNDGGDLMRVTGSFSAVAAFGNTGEDHIAGPGGNGSGVFLAFGNRDRDTILGSISNSFIFGNRDHDTLSAYNNPDSERDYVFGNRGNDDLYGNSDKKDRLFGGWGSDDKTRDTIGVSLTSPVMPTIAAHNLPFGDGDMICRQQKDRPRTGAKR